MSTISSSSSSSSSSSVIPFNSAGKYTGSITLNLYAPLKQEGDAKASKVFYPVIEGARLKIEPFTELYRNEFKKRFGLAIDDRDELSTLRKIYSNPDTVGLYNDGKLESAEATLKRLHLDSSRSLSGNVFTGYNVIDKESNATIGRLAIGGGYSAGQSHSGMLLDYPYQTSEEQAAKLYGKEATILVAAFAKEAVLNGWKVGGPETGTTVTSFSGTANKNNLRSIALMKRLGFTTKTELNEAEKKACPDHKVFLEITADKVASAFDSLIQSPSQVKVNYLIASTQ